MSVHAYIALGSNIADPLSQIQRALSTLATTPHIQLICHSPLYTNPPMGPILQPDYVNAVAHIQTTLVPEALLACLHIIEHEQGRRRHIPWGPRTLDLDILLFGDTQLATPTLSIPHPGLYTRGFVLIPLADIAPDLLLPSGLPVTHYITDEMRSDLVPLFLHEEVF